MQHWFRWCLVRISCLCRPHKASVHWAAAAAACDLMSHHPIPSTLVQETSPSKWLTEKVAAWCCNAVCLGLHISPASVAFHLRHYNLHHLASKRNRRWVTWISEQAHRFFRHRHSKTCLVCMVCSTVLLINQCSENLMQTRKLHMQPISAGHLSVKLIYENEDKQGHPHQEVIPFGQGLETNPSTAENPEPLRDRKRVPTTENARFIEIFTPVRHGLEAQNCCDSIILLLLQKKALGCEQCSCIICLFALLVPDPKAALMQPNI